jgi:hypothetical protein
MPPTLERILLPPRDANFPQEALGRTPLAAARHATVSVKHEAATAGAHQSASHHPPPQARRPRRRHALSARVRHCVGRRRPLTRHARTNTCAVAPHAARGRGTRPFHVKRQARRPPVGKPHRPPQARGQDLRHALTARERAPSRRTAPTVSRDALERTAATSLPHATRPRHATVSRKTPGATASTRQWASVTGHAQVPRP